MKITNWLRNGCKVLAVTLMLGGLALGVLATAVITFIGGGGSGRGFGILGGGYGAVQAAISGADWLPLGWTGVLLLLGLSLV